MTTREKIRALRAKAESTTFPGEAAVFNAKADELEARLGESVDDDSPGPGVVIEDRWESPARHRGMRERVVPYGTTGVYSDTFYGGGGGL